MRHVGRHQDQIRRLILPDVIADETPTAAVQRQREFVLGMVVPFLGNFGHAAVINAERAAVRERDTLELGLHAGTDSDI